MYDIDFIKKQAAERGIPWEYLLTVNLILYRLSKAKERCKGLPLKKIGAVQVLSAYESSLFVNRRLSELNDWVEYVASIYSIDISGSWGVFGQEGEETLIRKACDKLIESFEMLFLWEESLGKVIPHGAWVDVFSKLEGTSLYFIEEMEVFFEDFSGILNNPDSVGEYNLVFNFTFPRNMNGIHKAIRRAQQKSKSEASSWDDLWVDLLKKIAGL